jgi:hypothetical protein
MRVTLALLVLAASSAAQQVGPQLGPAQFVAKDVREVYWAPNAKAVVYLQEDGSGRSLGVYDLEQDKAASVRPLAADERVDAIDWLGSGRQALAVIRNGKGEVTVCDLDAIGQKCHTLWSRKPEEQERIDVHLTPSPLLDHALVWVVASVPGPTPDAERVQVEEDWVVLLGGKRMVRAVEVTAAKRQGYHFATWSQGGSAVFTDSAMPLLGDLPMIAVRLRLGEDAAGEAGSVVTQAVQLADASDKERLLVVQDKAFKRYVGLRLAQPIEPGAPVLECMPSNAVMRQVRFPGAHEPTDHEPKTAPKFVLQGMTEGGATEGVQSLWLVQPTTEDGAKPWKPVLVSAQAEGHWLAESERAIAFTWSGALFVRTVR